MQVLAIVESSGINFYYGQSTAAFSGATASVDVAMAPLSSSGCERRRRDRRCLLTANDAGPTGKVDMYLSQPGIPEMKVAEMEIFNGWFNFFAMRDIAFSYRMGGQPLAADGSFEGVVVGPQSPLLAKSVANTASARALIYLPPHWETRNGSAVREPQPATHYLYGFFGPGLASENLRYPNPAPTPAHIPGFYATNDANNPAVMTWAATALPPSQGGAGAVTGLSQGVPTSSMATYCTSAPSTSLLCFDPTVAGHGHDEALGFKGPFKKSAGADFLQVAATGSVTLTWQYLPNMAIDGARIFARVGTLSQIQRNLDDVRADTGVACDQLANVGFVALAEVAHPTATYAVPGFSTVGGTALTASDVVTRWNAGEVQFVACPYKGAVQFNSAIQASNFVAGGMVSTLVGVAGVNGSADGTGAAASMFIPEAIARDANGDMYVADTGNHTIRKVTAAGVVTLFAGQVSTGGVVNSTPLTSTFDSPGGIAVNAAGDVYVSDPVNHVIRKIAVGGNVSTFAGVAGNVRFQRWDDGHRHVFCRTAWPWTGPATFMSPTRKTIRSA